MFFSEVFLTWLVVGETAICGSIVGRPMLDWMGRYVIGKSRERARKLYLKIRGYSGPVLLNPGGWYEIRTLDETLKLSSVVETGCVY